jgi:hypothetical protein
MVKVLFGNSLDSKAQTLVNTVNCVGIMGKGLALEFKEQFPDKFTDYVARCNRYEVRLGKPYLFRRLTQPWILNFPTKGRIKHQDYPIIKQKGQDDGREKISTQEAFFIKY